jgi:hypothetical protein
MVSGGLGIEQSLNIGEWRLKKPEPEAQNPETMGLL